MASNPREPIPESLKDAKESREWLRVTLASIGDAVITTDVEGRCTFLNYVAETLTGWTNAEATSGDGEGRGVALPLVFRIVNQDTRKEVENPALRALRDGMIVGLANHTVLISRDGSERPIDDSAAPIRNSKGEVAGSVLVFRDITARRRAEEAKALLAAIVESSDDAIISKDLTGVITSWNKGAEHLFGYSAEEAIGQSVTMLIPKERASEEPEILARLERGEAVDHYETERQRKDGSRVHVSLTVSPVRDSKGRIVGASKVARDITEKHEHAEALRQSEVRYRRLFQAAKDGILILNIDTGRVIDANAFMEGLLGLDHAEILGKELHEIGLFRDTEENRAAFGELQRTGYMRYDHLPIQNRRGEAVAVEIVSNVYREDHRVVAQCNIRDVTDRVKMQTRIAEQAEQIATESRRKDEFLAMLSHELRNPLAPIGAAVHLMRIRERGSEDPIAQQAREIIERQVASLTKLVDDLLEVSRVVSGRIHLERQVVDLSQVSKHAVETVTPIIEKRGHDLVLHLCEDPVWASVDPTRMEQVFVNLLNNAAKYTPDGGRIEVWCEHPVGANFAQFRVRDSGIGIDKDLLPRIFDLFSQADRSLARSAGGLGVGLSLAHRLVDMHGGTIEAHSPPNGLDIGSEFVVRLPVVPAPPEVARSEAPTGEASGQPEGLRVLVVDDNIDQALMVTTALRLKGYLVQSAYTGPDGLKTAQQWRPDIILLDIGLPGLDGYEVARRIRSAPELDLKKARLVAVTGYGRDVDVDLARDAGFDAHLTKPVDFKDLEKMLVTPELGGKRTH